MALSFDPQTIDRLRQLAQAAGVSPGEEDAVGQRFDLGLREALPNLATLHQADEFVGKAAELQKQQEAEKTQQQADVAAVGKEPTAPHGFFDNPLVQLGTSLAEAGVSAAFPEYGSGPAHTVAQGIRDIGQNRFTKFRAEHQDYETRLNDVNKLATERRAIGQQQFTNKLATERGVRETAEAGRQEAAATARPGNPQEMDYRHLPQDPNMIYVQRDSGWVPTGKRVEKEPGQGVSNIQTDGKGNFYGTNSQGKVVKVDFPAGTHHVGTKDEVEQNARLDRIADAVGSKMPLDPRRILSIRNDELSILYDKILQKYPDTNMAEIEARVNIVRSFSDPKSPAYQQVQSFGTFVLHDADVVAAAKKYAPPGSPLLSMTLNQIRQKLVGDPQATALIAAMIPAQHEFNAFLLNNRAEYAQDREKTDAILSADMPLQQIIAAAETMGHVVGQRWKSANHMYFRATGQDIPNPFHPSVLPAAASLGIDLSGEAGQPQGQQQGAPNDPLGIR